MVKLCNVSKIGKRHIASKQLCQDRSISGERIVYLRKNVPPTIESIKYIAVADGVGSSRYSGTGADYAITLFLNNIEKLYYNIVIEEDHDKANRSLDKFLRFMRASASQYAENIGTTKEELATTLSFAIMDNKRTFVLSVGDSPVCVKLKGRNLIRENGNIKDGLANETVSVFSSCCWDVVHAEVFGTDDVEAVFCVTDGADILTHPKDGIDPIDWIKDIIGGNETVDHIATEIVNLQNDDVSIAYIIP